MTKDRGSQGEDGPGVTKVIERPPPPDADERTLRAWRQWLSSMSEDAEAALAAALAYRELDDEGRLQWLDALDVDAEGVDAPRVALYAPLLAVEDSLERRQRILEAMDGCERPGATSGIQRAFYGRDREGTRVSVVIVPLYLDFVQVLACGFNHEGFKWVRHDPIVDRRRAPQAGFVVQGARLETTPFNPLLDELASAVLAHRRSGRELPEALGVLAGLLEVPDTQVP